MTVAQAETAGAITSRQHSKGIVHRVLDACPVAKPVHAEVVQSVTLEQSLTPFHRDRVTTDETVAGVQASHFDMVTLAPTFERAVANLEARWNARRENLLKAS
jgi:hypothetical protein